MHSAASRAPADVGLRWRPVGQCAVCRDWGRDSVCSACVERFASPVARCQRCGLRTATRVPACGACLADPPPFDACVVALDYAFPWDRLIADFKFNGRVELAATLARRMLQAIRHDGRPPPAWVLPVPLAPQRLAERGYNQAWELARQVARRLGLRADAGRLQRPIDGVHQAGLPLAQRQRSLHGAFMPNPARREGLRGSRVALVDDVMTSGATLAEAAAALRRAGAAWVEAWVLARTPAPDAA